MAAFLLSIALMLDQQAGAPNQTTAAPDQGKCTVFGKVLSVANEAPLTGATVRVYQLGGNGNFSSETDVAGRFEIINVEPGKYWFVASHPGFLERYYGDHPESPRYLVISPGQTSADISIRLPPEAIITGHVYDEDGKPIEHANTFHVRGRVINAVKIASPAEIEVRLLRRIPDGDWLDAAGVKLRAAAHVKGSQGYFDIPDVLPGSYWASAQLEEGGELDLVRQLVTVVNADVEGIRLFLTPGPALAGSVEVEGSVTLSQLRVSLVDYLGGYDWKHHEAAMKADGSFKFDRVPDNHYFLRVSGIPQNSYVKSATLGGQDILDSGFEISGGLAPGPKLKIVVGSDGGQLAGTVMLDSKPLNGALVTLLPADSSKLSSDWWCKSTETDGDGKFAFVGIRPGDYRVFAWQKITLLEVRNPTFLARFEDEGQEVQVGSGAPFTLQLDAIPARTLP